MNGNLAHRWFARLVAATIGISAINSVLFNGSQLIGGWSFVSLLPLFALFCSLVGVWGAIEMWRFRPLGWWIAAWFGMFSALSALAPLLILGGRPTLDALQIGWVLLLCVSLAYLFTPNAMTFYRISAGWRTASLGVLGAAVLCVVLLFAYPAYFVVRATWFPS